MLKFWQARFWRLYPTYILIVVVNFVLATVTPYTHLPNFLGLQSEASHSVIFRTIINWLINGSMLFLNIPSTQDLLISPGWSLGIEVAFYAIAPFCLRLATWKVCILVAISVTLQFLPYGQHAPLLFGFHFFLLGAMARRHTAKIELIVSRAGNPPLWLLYCVVIILIVLALPSDLTLGQANAHSHNNWDRLFYPFVFAGIIPLLHERSKSIKFDSEEF